MTDILERLETASANESDQERQCILFYAREEISKLREIVEHQRQRLESLCEGTYGSTPALVQLARKDMEIDRLRAEYAALSNTYTSLQAQLYDAQKKLAEAEMQEPVAWISFDVAQQKKMLAEKPLRSMNPLAFTYTPLYAAPMPAKHGNQDREDAERWRYVRQFLDLDDVGDEEFLLGLVVNKDSLEEAVTPHAARLYCEQRQRRWEAEDAGEVFDEPVITLDQAIDAARAGGGA